MRRRPRDDGGFSLVEISTAVVLLGLSATVILGGLFTVVRTSRVSTEQARVEAVLSNAADRLTGWTYTPCPPATGPGSYTDVVQAAAGSVGWPTSAVSIVSVLYFDPTITGSNPWITTNQSGGGACNPSVTSTSPRTLQKITVRVTAPGSTYSRQLEVVKNNVVADQP